MNARAWWISALVLTSLLASAAPAAEPADAAGCGDHPLITRMPHFSIRLCEGAAFDRHEFSSEEGPIAVEGKRTTLYYVLVEGSRAPGTVAIVRNHLGALKKIGATVVYDGGGRATLKLTKGKAETWVGIGADADYEYRLDIVEKGGMVQDVVASADALAQDLTTSGRAALYGLYFDTGKAVVKAASEASLKEIATLLGRDPALKLFVVGHTDNVGAVASNLALSKARAEAVVQALTTRHGVGAGRLAAFGVGPLSPVATNLTEAGRALNRRVELAVQ